MRVVTWNLRQGTDAKWDHVEALAPDVAVLCEVAERPVRSEATLLGPGVSWEWEGVTATKGLAIAGFGPTLRRRVARGAIGRWSIAADVEGLTVLGIWSCPARGGNYAAEVVRGIDSFSHLGLDTRTVVAGDFNAAPSGAGWRALADRLSALGLVSCYHRCHREAFGAESRPTFLARHAGERSFHIDYCFVSADLVDAVSSAEIGPADPAVSDHAPVVVELDR
ncbi:MAG: hypothetical protein OEY23_02285 [Acidimicrobiia bacterium]|nr:hypothetical protein [Acidimicrobiia bacterium]